MANPQNCLKDLPITLEVKQYQKIMKIGQGSYGEVFKAKHKTTRELVAMKKLHTGNKGGDMSQACLKEICVLNVIRHKNIISLKELCKTSVVRRGNYSTSLYLIFEFCEYDLRHLIQNQDVQFTEGQVKMFLKQILQGMYYMHNNNVMHRDLKPANIFVSKNGTVKIGDLGLARPFWDLPDKQNTFTALVGTLWYAAPEILLGEKRYTTAIDMWSFGCLMIEFWSRSPIMAGKSQQKQLKLIVDLCGSLNPEIWPGVIEYDLYKNIIHVPRNRILVQTLGHFINDKLALDLIDSHLALNPRKRINADESLNHDYFWTNSMPEDLQPLMASLTSEVKNNLRKRPRQEDAQLVSKRRRIA